MSRIKSQAASCCSSSSLATLPLPKTWLNSDEPYDEYQLYSTGGPIPKKPAGAVRVWLDGIFDMLHFGHANVIRQASRLGTELIIGCSADYEVVRYKGPPVMKSEERYEALRACKWVTYVVENYPYTTRLKDMRRFEIDLVVHGDDVTYDLNGRNSYQEIIDAGLFKVVKRTEGISTTEIVGRMLRCRKSCDTDTVDKGVVPGREYDMSDVPATSTYFLTTSRKIVQFSNDKPPESKDKIVYVDGSFDLFHLGHIRLLQKAREYGDYVIVGIYQDDVVQRVKGEHFPIMNLNERVLGVLACRYVDEVVLGAPNKVTPGLIKSLNISVVVSGKLCDSIRLADGDAALPYSDTRDNYRIEVLDSLCNITIDSLIKRVFDNWDAFKKKHSEKTEKDEKAEENKPSAYLCIEEIE